MMEDNVQDTTLVNPQILLTALDASSLNFYKEITRLLDLNFFIQTDVLGYQGVSHIASKKYQVKQMLFGYFRHLYPSFNMIVLISVTLISFVFTLCENMRSLQIFIDNFFNLITSLFSPNKPKLVKSQSHRSFSMTIIGFWLLSFTAFVINFKNFIVEDMIIPINLIDSWDDLFHRPEIKIIAQETDSITEYSNLFDTEMALSFRDRISYLFPDYESSDFTGIVSELLSGKSVLINDKLPLISEIMYMQRLKNEKFIEDIHVSKHGGIQQPYFAITTLLADPEFLKAFNFVQANF